MTDIPAQTIISGQSFETIDLNTYGSDTDLGDSITWGYSGNTEITVEIVDGIATLTYTGNWIGSENITFTATDTHGANASSTASFTVSNNPPVVNQIPDQTIITGQSFTTINLNTLAQIQMQEIQ